MATVTVTIPTWNRSRLVRDAIDSVLSQTFSDWDLVVLDNASTDDTVAIVEAYDDPRIRLIRHEQNMGLVKNINSALRAGAESRYTALLMSDDVMYPTNLERKVEFLERHPEAGMVHSAYKLVGNDGNVLSELASMAWPNQSDSIESSTVFMRRSFEFPCRVWMSCAVMKSEIAGQLALRDRDFPADDHRLWLEAGRLAPVGYLHEPLASMCVTPGASTVSGYQTITASGDFTHSVLSLVCGRRILQEYLLDQDWPWSEKLRLRGHLNAGFRRQIARVIRNEDSVRVRLFSPAVRRILRDAALIDPTVTLHPRTWKALLGG